ncbi:protein of unknown function [Escherichia coli]|nr:protein of unknown function [Escherichia coli]
METEAFGDSNATRTTDAFLETECVENVATTEIIKATEESNYHRVSLPLSVFNPGLPSTADYRFRKNVN